MTAGALFFPAAEAQHLLGVWQDWTSRASNQVTTTFRLLCLPPLPEVPEPLRTVPIVCVDGVALQPSEAHTLEEQLRNAATPILGGFGPMPSAGIIRLHRDPEDPVPALTDGMLLHGLDDGATEAFPECRRTGIAVAGGGAPAPRRGARHVPARGRRARTSGGRVPSVRRGYRGGSGAGGRP